ncbi:MAG TPA: nuclear transport factor 2 family protein [Stellaceae bacterium]|jgi:hypothetical protein|nr:nuclear transport factor 2 family protein [Stellaceae bacterium]
MTASHALQSLTEAVQRYLDLMYDADLTRFDQVFRSTAQLHGFRDGAMTVLPAAAYRELLAGRPSPRSVGAPREEAILLVDFASETQALVKLRVRIHATVFIDYLLYHRIEGAWLVTAKSYHVEHSEAASPA